MYCPVTPVIEHTGDGFLKTFFAKTKDMTPEQRADFLEEDDVSSCVMFLYDAHHY